VSVAADFLDLAEERRSEAAHLMACALAVSPDAEETR
jgi:hypothetical protein